MGGLERNDEGLWMGGGEIGLLVFAESVVDVVRCGNCLKFLVLELSVRKERGAGTTYEGSDNISFAILVPPATISHRFSDAAAAAAFSPGS